MASQLLPQQTSVLWGSMSGLPRLVQSQLLLAACGQQQLRSCCSGASQQRSFQSATPATVQASTSSSSSDGSSSATSSGSSSSSGSRGAKRRQYQYEKRLNAYKSRLPRAQKYGPMLREKGADAFEQMRLVVGYYDMPQNLNKQRPSTPSHVTINNIQTILYTKNIDPYYKLALLSYRSKLQNKEIVEGLSKTRSFLGRLSAQPDFVPAHLEELTAAALKQEQQQQQQQQQQPTAEEQSPTAEEQPLTAEEQQEESSSASSESSSAAAAQ